MDINIRLRGRSPRERDVYIDKSRGYYTLSVYISHLFGQWFRISSMATFLASNSTTHIQKIMIMGSDVYFHKFLPSIH